MKEAFEFEKEKGCDNCKYITKDAEQYPCNRCKRNYADIKLVDMWKNRSNADHIRAMSDEELAEFLLNFKNTFGEGYEGEMSCLDWLKLEKGE